jgi:ATP-dependent helicase/nuclease subunit A
MDLKIISAGAGSGKTYRLTRELTKLLTDGLRPEGIFATTFTRKAAAELQERVRISLLAEGFTDQANALSNALIGTVHSLGVKLLQRFSFEAGVSPQVSIIAEEDGQHIFNQSIAMVLGPEVTEKMEGLCDRLGLNKKERYDWRQDVRRLADTARANDFKTEQLLRSRDRSWSEFEAFLPEVEVHSDEWWSNRLQQEIQRAIDAIAENSDATKATQDAVSMLQMFGNRIRRNQPLFWHEWAKISKLKVGAKSRADVEDLKAFALKVESHQGFREDIRDYIFRVFDLSIEALIEYERYKQERGLIDYTDMEAMVNTLLDNPEVRKTVSEDIDLLMVDEFQDTSPIQLSIFWKLSKLVGRAIWVGDPKQSIYGFRGADPSIMRGIVEENGGIRPENILGFSWRSREDLVNTANAIFTKVFSDLPEEQVALEAKRLKATEGPEMRTALMHWHFEPEEGKQTNKEWMGHCIARSVGELLNAGLYVTDKQTGTTRPARPGDVAILCRTNKDCQQLAEAIHQAGLTAAVSREGLTHTPEIRLIVACLKYVLNDYDSLSVAEILRLSGASSLQEIIDERIEWVTKKKEDRNSVGPWGEHEPLIRTLRALRPNVVDLSSAEILDLVLNELHIRHIVAAWGQFSRRQDNIDALRQLATKYEDACNRLQSGASLGGFLLWLDDLHRQKKDSQGSGEGPDAIRVLTYHRSKGLEWPVVVCHDMDNALRDSVYGLRLEEEKSGKLDLEDILGNRWIRFWVNPYQDQEKDMPLTQKLAEPEGPKEKATRTALNEEARLLYVGLTRARDYLIIPSREKKPLKWLNRCWHDGEENAATLIPGMSESPWIWNDTPIPVHAEIFTRPRTFEEVPAPDHAHLFFTKPAGRTSHPPLIILPEEDPRLNAPSPILGPFSYHPPLQPEQGTNEHRLTSLLEAFLIADYPEYSYEVREDMARRLLATSALDYPKPEGLVAYSDAFHEWENREFGTYTEIRLVPVRVELGLQKFEGMADNLLDTEDALVVIKHVHSSGKSSQLLSQSAAWSAWARVMRNGLANRSKGRPVRVFLNMLLHGCLTELGEGNT